mmetsp:Transcript_23489/g.38736  ORF Transcript_23489/g.38736 Transcript_23489/m.38736 type:complete len:360 (-) Transcript_23489:128-1207(-)
MPLKRTKRLSPPPKSSCKSKSSDTAAPSSARMSKGTISAIVLILALLCDNLRLRMKTSNDASTDRNLSSEDGEIKLRYKTWEEAPASYEEFDHDNHPSVCRLPVVTVEEWEKGRMWEGETPVIVKNVTDGWKALEHWTKEELLRRYPDIVVGMGNSKDLGQTGPDQAGDALTRTTIHDYIHNWMHSSNKYIFDRNLRIPDGGFLEDCQPYPMPTRMFAEDPDALFGSGMPENLMWKDHLALTIGHDTQGLTFHRHNAAWNAVIFGAKRWILYDAERISNITRLKTMTRDVRNPIQLDTANWIRKLYNKDDRKYEIRNYGHDCVQRAGEMMYVPRGWAHMVLNIGDTVAVVSERGLDGVN